MRGTRCSVLYWYGFKQAHPPCSLPYRTQHSYTVRRCPSHTVWAPASILLTARPQWSFLEICRVPNCPDDHLKVWDTPFFYSCVAKWSAVHGMGRVRICKLIPVYNGEMGALKMASHLLSPCTAWQIGQSSTGSIWVSTTTWTLNHLCKGDWETLKG